MSANRKQLLELLGRIHEMLRNNPPRRKRKERSMFVPGFEHTGRLWDLSVQDVLVPAAPAAQEDRVYVISEILHLIGSDTMSTAEIMVARELVGRTLLEFISAGKDVAERYALLLWAFGRCEGVGVELDKAATTLMLHDHGVDYGIHKGAIVGGPFEGERLVPSLDQMIYVEREVRRYSQNLAEIDTTFQSLTYSEDYAMGRLAFTAFMQRNLWDTELPFSSAIQMYRGPQLEIDKLVELVWTVDDPHIELQQRMIGRCMTAMDFREAFGQYKKPRRPATDNTRNKLTAVLYSLPFLRKNKNEKVDRHSRQGAQR